MPKEQIIGFGERSPVAADKDAAKDAPHKERIGFIRQKLEQREKDTAFEVAGFGRELKPHKELPSEEGWQSFMPEFGKMRELGPGLQEKVDDLLRSLNEREIGLHVMLGRQLKHALDGIQGDTVMPVEERLEHVRLLRVGAEFYSNEMRKIADAFRWRIFTWADGRPESLENDEVTQWEKHFDALNDELTEELAAIEMMTAQWVNANVPKD